jgi:hypothetical protein
MNKDTKESKIDLLLTKNWDWPDFILSFEMNQVSAAV